MIAALLLVAATPVATRLLAITEETVEGRPAVTIVALGPLDNVSVRQEAGDIVVFIPADAPEGFRLPAPAPPAEQLQLRKAPGGVELWVHVPKVPYELRRDGSRLRLLLGTQPTAEAAEEDVRRLYPKLFPSVSADQSGVRGGEGLGATTGTPTKEGIVIGSASLRPSVTAGYVNADATVLSTPAPINETYYETRPRVELDAPFGAGQLTGDYEARIRSDASLPVLKTTSQEADGKLTLPVTPRLDLRVSDHFFKGALEASEVDPGSEYFFNLGLFNRNDLEAQTRVDVGSRLFMTLGAGWNHVHVDQSSAFFSYDEEKATGGLGLDLGPNLSTSVEYAYVRIPFAADRPEVESHSQSVELALRGDLTPLTKLQLAAGYRNEVDPGAGPGGQSYRGLVFSASASRDLTVGSTLGLTASRTTLPSGFENNGFYVSTATALDLTCQLPFRVAFHGGAGYRWNDYQVIAQGTSSPRNDRIFGYSVGLGRSLTRWGFVRVDYRRDRRTSNLSTFSTQTHSFTLELGIGYLGGGGQP